MVPRSVPGRTASISTSSGRARIPPSTLRRCPSGRRRRNRAALWGIALTLAIAGGLGTGWRVLCGHPDPDRLWAEAERSFLAGHHDRARGTLATLGRLRPKTGLDRLLEAQLATAEGRSDDALAAIAQIP